MRHLPRLSEGNLPNLTETSFVPRSDILGTLTDEGNADREATKGIH